MAIVYVERENDVEYWDDEKVYNFVVNTDTWGLTVEDEEGLLVAAYAPGSWWSVWMED